MSELNSKTEIAEKLWRWELAYGDEVEFGLALGSNSKSVLKSLEEKFPKAANIRIIQIEFNGDKIAHTGYYCNFKGSVTF